MALDIEDYALIGDCETAALVGKNGSIDWLCWPDFSSPACFAALLGTADNGRWLLGPRQPAKKVTRQYQDQTLILETQFETVTGVLLLVDFMPVRETHSDVVRIVRCVSGRVPVYMELCVRFDFGRTVPWTGARQGNRWAAAAGTGIVYLRTQQEVRTKREIATAEFTLDMGEQRTFVLSHTHNQEKPPRRINVAKALGDTQQFWREWCAANTYDGPWRDCVERSLITLKALTYRPSGGIVAAPTTSLPEHFASDRNWDYRFCWLRDTTLTLESLLSVGYQQEAESWQEWLLQAVGSDVRGLQVMYGMRGERHLPECELPWLQGYRGSKPVRMGNAASEQVQLDVYGEVADAIVSMKRAGMHCDPRLFRLQRDLTNHVASIRHRPAAGIWERRGQQKHYTYSKAMAWLALHHGVEELQASEGPYWKIARDRLHRQICRRGFNRKLRSFVQSFDSDVLDASVLLLPIFGFLPFTDERITSTIDVIQRKLGREGFIYRLPLTRKNDRESAFLACSFWMVENLVGAGRRGEAEKLLERTISCKNDVGLLSEEYNPCEGRLMGNFPQALSHIALVNACRALALP